jgi:hypothetical protein
MRVFELEGRSRHRLVATIFGVVCVAVIMLVGSQQALATPSGAAPGGLSSGANQCSETVLASSANSESNQTNSRILSNATDNSDANSTLQNATPQGESSRLTSVYDQWNFNSTSCVVSVTTVDRVYSLSNSSTIVGMLTVSTPVSGGSAGLPTVDQAPLQTSPTATVYGEWSGYEFKDSGNPSAIWDIPSVSQEGNDCGGGLFSYGYCEVTIWVGLNEAANGATGIAQVGTNQEVSCIYAPFFWDCSESYDLWYEFLPNNAYEVDCQSANSGAEVGAVSVYSGNSVYDLDITDYTAGNGCSVQQTMSMGAPVYSEIIGEDPVLNGGNPTVPNFGTFTFTGATIGDTTDLPSDGPMKLTQSPNISVGTLYYSYGACSGYTFSCFSETYT